MKKNLILYPLSILVGTLALVQGASAVVTAPFGSSDSIEDSYQVDPIAEGSYHEGDYACTGASHEHIHYHVDNDTDSQEFWGVVHEFAIVLEDDFVDTVDTSAMLCSDGGSFNSDGGNDPTKAYVSVFEDCGFDKDADLGKKVLTISGGRWSGVSVTYQTLNWIDGSPKGLVWRYGTSDSSDIDLKPWLAGGEQQVEGISFHPNDYDVDQTVTTSSWTKMEYYYIDPDDVYSDPDSWHHTYTESVEPYKDELDPDGDYIYWYGLNGTEVSNFPACPPEEGENSCKELTLYPTTLSVNDVFNDVDLEVQVTGTDGTSDFDITNDVTFTYTANKYGTSDPTAADADGIFFSNFIRKGNSLKTSDPTVQYRDSEPGDSIFVAVTDYEGKDYSDTCYAELVFPWCEDLNIIDPSSPIFISTDSSVDFPIEIEATATTGEDWPYSVEYYSTDGDATFDGNTSIYTTTDWTIDSYQSEENASVQVNLDDENGDGESDDVASSCSDSFSYGTPAAPTCADLFITIPTSETLTCEEITAGDVQITWTSFLTDGSPATGPWLVTSSNPAGTFSLTPGGAVIGTGSALVTVSTVYYNGEDGDTIQVLDTTDPTCVDILFSEPCTTEENPVCEDLTLSDPYFLDERGDKVSIDLSKDSDLDLLYAESTVCWDYTLNTSDPSYTGTLMAEGFTDNTRSSYSGEFTLIVNETGDKEVGNPVGVGVSGLETYTGTLCWENFEAGNVLSIYSLGDESVCSDEEIFPIRENPEAPVCVDLQMSPDSYTLSPDEERAGSISISIDIEGSDSTWTGTLIVERTGTGDLFYSDGSPSTESDGHLEIPVSGTSTSVVISYIGGEAGDVVTSYIESEVALCTDNFTIIQRTESAYCEDLSLTPDGVEMKLTDTDAGTIHGTVVVNASSSTWTGTLIISKTGSGTLYTDPDSVPSTYPDGHLAVSLSGTSNTINFTYIGGKPGDIVNAYIESETGACSDDFTIIQPEIPRSEFCEDLSLTPDGVEMKFADSDAGTIHGSATVKASSSTWTGTLIISKTGSGTLYTDPGLVPSTYPDGHLAIALSGTSNTINFTYIGGKPGDNVRAYIESDPSVCSDTFTITQPELPPTPEVCEEINFEEDELQVDYNCEDRETKLCVEGDSSGSRDVEICYYNEDGSEGEFEYNGRTYEGCEEISIPADSGEEVCSEITFNEVCEDAEISVLENGEVCEDIPVKELEIGEFKKFIYTFNFSTEKNSYTDDGVFFSHDEDRAFYTLQYDPAGDEGAITFTDEMWTGDLDGKKGNGEASGGSVHLATTYSELVEGESGFYNYKLITNMGFGDEHEENSDELAQYVQDNFNSSYSESFIPYIKYRSEKESERIEACEYDDETGELLSEEVCYDPKHTPESSGDVVIENTGTVEDLSSSATIRVRYVGVIDSGLNCGDESDECLTEEFENNAAVEVYDGFEELTASARLVVLCSYLMTQNAGDIYLEVSLESGSDISCIFVDEDTATSSDYRNSDALIILEGLDSTSDGSSYGNSYFGSTVSFCDDDESSNDVIGNLSSYVCEIVNKVNELWASQNVESTTDSHVSQAIRNADTNQSASDSTYTSWSELKAALTNKNNPSSHILYFDGDLSSAGALTLGTIEVPAGAWTVIVENADLILSGNISYAGVINPSDYKNLPSIAFVVQGGDIYIKHTALKLVGVYYTNQKFDGDERSAVDEQLTVDGSFYGNIQTLIEKAKYVGPPTVNGGGIVLRYDSRILLNTPPALSEYVDVDTEKAIN